MTSAAQKKLDALLEKERQLKKQIQQEKQRISADEKKKDTRRKILVGAYFIDSFKDKPDELKNIMDNYLSRPDDRKLFELESKK